MDTMQLIIDIINALLTILILKSKRMNTPVFPCLGAVIGDTVGSIYEFNNIKTTDFPLFSDISRPTDDSVMTMAVAEWLLTDADRSQIKLEESMVRWAHLIPNIGYGPSFKDWLFCPYYKNMDLYAPHIKAGEKPEEIIRMAGIRRPYYSWGNGSAMRVSACGWVARTMDEAIDLARRSAIITHNHPEGIRGAEATAAAIFLALHGADKEKIRSYIEERFYYDLHTSCDEIRTRYGWDVSCQGTVPPAIVAFLDSHDFVSAIRLAVSLGGDSDTLACITGGIAQAYYKEIPDEIIEEMRMRLPRVFWDVMNKLAKVNEK